MAASNRNRLLPISAIFVRKSGRPDFRAVVPSFVLREPQDGRPSKSAVADFDTLRLPKSGKPDFGARPPQDEVRIFGRSIPLRAGGERRNEIHVAALRRRYDEPPHFFVTLL